MHPDNSEFKEFVGTDISFTIKKDAHSKDIYLIFMKKLFNLCQNALNDFLTEADEIVPNTRQGKSSK